MNYKSKNVDVLMILPPKKQNLSRMFVDTHPPLNQGIDSVPLRLATIIEEEFRIDILFLNYILYKYSNSIEDKEYIISKLNLLKPKVIIFATDYWISNRSTAYVNPTIEISELCKQYLPDTKIIVVGKQPMIDSSIYFEDTSAIDICVVSYPEELINNLISSIITKSDLSNIPNIRYRKNYEIISTEYKPQNIDFSSLPVPAYNILARHKKELLSIVSPFCSDIYLTIRSSSGCPLKCDYCAGISQWNSIMYRSKDRFREDIHFAKECLKDSFKFTFLDDEMFTFNKDHVLDIVNVLLEEEIVLRGVFSHVHFFNKDVAALLKGCVDSIMFGAENFDDKVLRSLNKKNSLKSILDSVLIAKKNGLRVRLEYIVGLPYEDIESVSNNLNMIYNLIASGKVDDISPYILVLHPGTKYQKNPSDFGIVIEESNYDNSHELYSYPQYNTKYLSSNQIFVYYLLVKEAIAMGKRGRNIYLRNSLQYNEQYYNQAIIRSLMEKIK